MIVTLHKGPADGQTCSIGAGFGAIHVPVPCQREGCADYNVAVYQPEPVVTLHQDQDGEPLGISLDVRWCFVRVEDSHSE